MPEHTLSELYRARPLDRAHLNQLIGCYYNHLAGALPTWHFDATPVFDCFPVYVLAHKQQDSRRYGQVGTVFMPSPPDHPWHSVPGAQRDYIPVFLFQNAGREGDDHAKVFFHSQATLFAFRAQVQAIAKELTSWGRDMPPELWPNPNTLQPDEGRTEFIELDINTPRNLLEFYDYRFTIPNLPARPPRAFPGVAHGI